MINFMAETRGREGQESWSERRMGVREGWDGRTEGEGVNGKTTPYLLMLNPIFQFASHPLFIFAFSIFSNTNN